MGLHEVKIGRIQIPGENFASIQAQTDSGYDLWRLNPVRTAQEIGSKHLGLRLGDSYTFMHQEKDRKTGRYSAFVQVTHGISQFIVELSQPLVQGSKGIWTITSVKKQGSCK